MDKEYSELSSNLKEIIAGKDIEKSDLKDIEYYVTDSFLFGEKMVKSTKPIILKAIHSLDELTGLRTPEPETIVDDAMEFEELIEETVVKLDNHDIDLARRVFRRDFAGYLKELQLLFLNFHPRLTIHSLYIEYLKKQLERVKKQLDGKKQQVRDLQERVKGLEKIPSEEIEEIEEPDEMEDEELKENV